MQTRVPHMPSPPNTNICRCWAGLRARSVRRRARGTVTPSPLRGAGGAGWAQRRGGGTAGRYKYIVLFPLLSLHGLHKAPAKFTSTLLLGSLLLNRT